MSGHSSVRSIKRNLSLRKVSLLRIFLFSAVASFSVLLSSLLLQWFIYDDWMHRTGPLRIVGTVLASFLTFAFVFRWQSLQRERHQEMLKRFALIARMNDRIRNAVQAIAFSTYASNPGAAEHVRQAVQVIDEALRGVIAESTPASIPSSQAELPERNVASRRTSA